MKHTLVIRWESAGALVPLDKEPGDKEYAEAVQLAAQDLVHSMIDEDAESVQASFGEPPDAL